nr:MAG TPA: Terminase small subunit [Caudoviricetes sp.]
MPDIRDISTQRAIADAYIENGGNQEKAVIAAGYSARYARGNAHKLVANSGVQRMIGERNAEIADSRIADMEEINAFWTAIMRDEEADRRDRLKASELRARAAGMFIDRVNLSGAAPVVIYGADAIPD